MDHIKMIKPLMIGITGGTASGKTTLCKNLRTLLGCEKKVVIISQDSYYKNPPQDMDVTKMNWDKPKALELSLLANHLQKLRSGESIEIPDWDFVKHERKDVGHNVEVADVYLIEGIFVLNNEEIRDQLDLKIYVEVDSDTRLSRRIQRDTKERGRSVDSVLYQYEKFVKPGYDSYTMPSKRFADIIVPYKCPNEISEKMIVGWISNKISSSF
jgi:uridine kinase